MTDYTQNGWDYTFQTSLNLEARQFKIVEQVAGDRVTDVGAGGGIGVLQNKPRAGEAAQVRRLGVSKVYAGGTITAGDYFKMASGGWALKINSGDALPTTSVGRANTAAASGYPFVAFVNPHRLVNAVSGSLVAAV